MISFIDFMKHSAMTFGHRGFADCIRRLFRQERTVQIWGAGPQTALEGS
jgi:hypothetical protein